VIIQSLSLLTIYDTRSLFNELVELAKNKEKLKPIRFARQFFTYNVMMLYSNGTVTCLLLS